MADGPIRILSQPKNYGTKQLGRVSVAGMRRMAATLTSVLGTLQDKGSPIVVDLLSITQFCLVRLWCVYVLLTTIPCSFKQYIVLLCPCFQGKGSSFAIIPKGVLVLLTDLKPMPYLFVG
jgi:hypothetical protein